MLRINRGGNRMREMVCENLGSDVVDNLHARGYILTGTVRTARQVSLLRELGRGSEVVPLFVSDGQTDLRCFVADGLRAVFKRLPDIDPVVCEQLDDEESSQGVCYVQQIV